MEDPQIPNYGSPEQGPIMKPGMVLCIEPMITLGTHRVRVLGDDWTAVTTDGKPVASNIQWLLQKTALKY